MSRSAAARTHSDHDERALRRPRPHGAAHARRVSGPAYPGHPAPAQTHMQTQADTYAPARPRIPVRPIRPPLRLAAGGAAFALRVADTALEVSGSRTMDRLVRSRAWVVIIGVGLIGIVAMQVSLLKLNAGIGRAVDTVATLERSNASLKSTVSQLAAGDRIQRLAGAQGFIMPEPADVTYLRAGDKRADSLRAARRMQSPDPAIAGPAGALTATDLSAALTGTPGAGAATAPTAATTTAVAPATAPTVPAAPAAPATTAPAPPPATAAPAPAPVAPPATATGTGASVGAAPAPAQTTTAGGVTLP